MSARLPDALGEMPLHVIVRDYPETLAVLRAAGIDVRAHGSEPLRGVAPESTALVDDIARVISWRGTPPSKPDA